MARKPLPTATETAVLVQSRRRCCICFGLDRDTRLKMGQIAHLDREGVRRIRRKHRWEADRRASSEPNLSERRLHISGR
ncbi:hypothetical protein EAH79_00750 [Sphingomonas koreensis]|nr:hypothetical protein EAH79_00750 [Sphingomonas koreensis]